MGPTARGTGQLHSPLGKLVMRVAHVAPIRARCFNSKRTSFHVALELEHVESVDLRSEVRKADAVLPVSSRVRASAATHSSASRGEAGVVCCFYSGCNTSPPGRTDKSTSADVSVPRPRTHDDRTGRVFPDHLITVPEIVIAISKNHNNDLQLRLETRETPQTKSNGEGSQAG